MARDDIFHNKPAELGHDPFWILVGLFVLTILASYCFDYVQQVHESDFYALTGRWEYFESLARNGGDIALVGLLVALIWFGTNRNWVFAAVLFLGLLNFGEKELVSRSLWEGFISFTNEQNWELVTAAAAVMVAIVSMPMLKWLTRSKLVVSRSVSIADIMLLTLASAVLITSVHRIASSENGWSFGQGYGVDLTAEHLIAQILLSFIGLTAVYASYFGRLIGGGLVYLLAWILYVGWIELIGVSNLRPTLDPEILVFENVWHGAYDHYIPVFAWFLLCILIARITSRLRAKFQTPVIANER